MHGFRRGYRSYRSRGYSGSNWKSKYRDMESMFGGAVSRIKQAFLNLDISALDELLRDYGALHGEAAEKYARKTYGSWKTGLTKLSGQTMERLVELVPPYLSPEVRIELVHHVIKAGQPIVKPRRYIRVNLEAPAEGFAEVDKALQELESQDELAYIPASAMTAATWLYDDDATAARAVIAQEARAECRVKKQSAIRELQLFRNALRTGSVQSADYTVELPAGVLVVSAYTPEKTLWQKFVALLK